ncbi:DegT/DnrJ/EryC1/StrS family aminotransferase, partial [Deinococcus wulumuqiensis]|uniref:DegT/DnrJ/EryC1/StrS family aminotransferase n=1 Tax=Deinococcus wulumuqiensis TaxID=980427 RepID=UPI0029901BBD
MTQNITADTIRPLITAKTRAIIPVHLAGWPCDMDPIMELAREHDLIVIEDCAQAHGAFYKGKPVGSIGHAGAFSFCQDKIMTTGGEGGLL